MLVIFTFSVLECKGVKSFVVLENVYIIGNIIMTNAWNHFFLIPAAFARLFSKDSTSVSEPINFPYFLHFFDVLLLQSLQKLAFSLTSIPTVLQASSSLPLDPPSHSSVVLSYPNMLLMRPNLLFHTLTHVHVSMCQTYWVHAHVVRVVVQTLVALVQNVLPVCQRFTHFTLRLSVSLGLLLSSIPPLSLGTRAWMCLWD